MIANDTISFTSETFILKEQGENIQYGSKSISDNLGDTFINDDIESKIIVKIFIS